MHDYEQYSVDTLRQMMRGIGIRSKDWPPHKAKIKVALAKWDNENYPDLAVNHRVPGNDLRGKKDKPALTLPTVATPHLPPQPPQQQQRKQPIKRIENEKESKQQVIANVHDASAGTQSALAAIVPTSFTIGAVDTAPTQSRQTRKRKANSPPEISGVPAFPEPRKKARVNLSERAEGPDITAEDHLAPTVRADPDARRDDDFLMPDSDEDHTVATTTNGPSHVQKETNEASTHSDNQRKGFGDAIGMLAQVQTESAADHQNESQSNQCKRTTTKDRPVQPAVRENCTKAKMSDTQGPSDPQLAAQDEQNHTSFGRLEDPIQHDIVTEVNVASFESIETTEQQGTATSAAGDGEQNAPVATDSRENDTDVQFDGSATPEDVEEDAGSVSDNSSLDGRSKVESRNKKGKNGNKRKQIRKEMEKALPEIRPLGAYSDLKVAGKFRVKHRTVKLKMDYDVRPGTERAPLNQLGSWRQTERIMEQAEKGNGEIKLWMSGDYDADDRERSDPEDCYP